MGPKHREPRRVHAPHATPRAGAPPGRQALLTWYRRHARDLPWRRTRDPYRVWVSEVMLQQTQVQTVQPYYEAFLRRFPSLAALASAPLAAVLKAWEGLGYYRRARNLHAAARICVAQHGGMPPGLEAMRRLPGVGAYTAAAVRAIAYGEPHLPLDGNIRRVLARFHDLDTSRDADYRAVGQPLLSGLSAPHVGDLVQALMELGATLCRPRNHRCPACPLRALCGARRAGTIAHRPRMRPRRSVPHHRVAIAYLTGPAQRVLLARRPDEGFLGGLWELPGGKIESGEGEEAALRRELREEAGITQVQGLRRIGSVEHAYTHFRVTLVLFEGRTRQRGRLGDGPAEIRWVDPRRLGAYAVPRGTRKALALRRQT